MLRPLDELPNFENKNKNGIENKNS